MIWMTNFGHCSDLKLATEIFLVFAHKKFFLFTTLIHSNICEETISQKVKIYSKFETKISWYKSHFQIGLQWKSEFKCDGIVILADQSGICLYIFLQYKRFLFQILQIQ
jgi:hypothetical protein